MLLYVHTHTHTRHATSALLYILSRFHTPAVPRYCTLSGAFAHMSCYATVRFVCASTIMACYFTLRSLPSTLMSCYAMYTLSCTCAHLSCYATVRSVAHRHAHTRHAISALLYILLRFHAHVMLRYCTFSCAFTLMSCYATFFAIPHTCHATLLYAFCLLHSTCSCHATLLHALFNLHTHVMLRYCTFSCTSTRIHKHTHTHTSCYKCATVHSLALPPSRHATVRSLPSTLMSCYVLSFSCASTHMSCYTLACSLALRHICHATLLLLLLHFHTHVMLRYCTFACLHFHLHTSCYYSTVCSLALPHSCHATLLYIASLVFRYCTFSCASTHMSCYANIHSLALPHTFLLRFCTFSCASTHMSCYTLARSLALPGTCHATLLYVFLRFHTHVMLHYCTCSGKDRQVESFRHKSDR